MSETAETAKLTVDSVVREFAGDVEQTAEKIAEIVRERIEGAQTTAKSVASVLCNLRKKLGVDAVPHRARGGGNGQSVKAWLAERMEAVAEGESLPSNKGLANEASEHFGRDVSTASIASAKTALKKAA